MLFGAAATTLNFGPTLFPSPRNRKVLFFVPVKAMHAKTITNGYGNKKIHILN